MVEAATEFRKSGFNDEDAANLALTASVFQNVADDAIGAGEAANFLVAQLIAFNMEAEDSIHVIDAINEVSNRFAVSSSDLSNTLGIVASTSSALGNSFEETLGMMTAIVEQTRNASKAARGLNTIFNNLAQVLDENSTNGAHIVKIFNDLNIGMYDNEGQLRSSYELLSELSKQWKQLDTNTRNYIASTIAGTNQLNNFLALMNNFGHATEATDTALNSAGSALRENARAMESLEAKTNQLKATFQDLANNVIENELVKIILDLANTGLKLLNNEVGHAITQWTLLTSVLGGGITIWGTVAKNLIGVASTGAQVVGGLSAIASKAFPLAAALSGVAVILGTTIKLFKESTYSTEEASNEIAGFNAQLQTNKERLGEISQLPWYDRTPEIIEEENALRRENAELELQIDKYQRLLKAKRDNTGYELTVGEPSAFRLSQQTLDGSVITRTFGTREELNEYLKFFKVDFNNLEGSLTKLGFTLEEVGGKASYSGEALKDKLTENVKTLVSALGDGGGLSDQLQIIYGETESTLQQLIDSGVNVTEYTQLLNQLSEAYETARIKSSAIPLTAEQLEKLSGIFPTLKNHLIEGENAFYLNVEALNAEKIKAGETKAELVKLYESTDLFNREDLDTSQKLVALQLLAIRAGETASVISSVLSPEALGAYIQQGIWDTPEEATAHFFQTMFERYAGLLENPPSPPVDYIEEQSKKYQEQLSLLQTKLEILQKSGATEEEQIEHIWKMQDELSKQIEWYRKQGLDENSKYILDAEKQWWAYQEQIIQIYDSIEAKAKEAWEKALQEQKDSIQKQMDELESQTSVYEKLFGYIDGKIQEEISLLEERKQSIIDSYDKEIEALKAENALIEDQIALEKAQEALAKARTQKVLVYKDGRYQYSEDIEAVSNAKATLESLQRQQALDAEVDRLEQLKNQAVASIDKQIDSWEEYSETWSNVVSDYEKEQDRLLIEQKLGIVLEKDNWKLRLDNLDTFVEKYEAKMAELVSLQNQMASLEGQQYVSTQKPTMNSKDEEALAAAGRAWSEANKRGDTAAMEAAHQAAESIRKKYRYSGGESGSDYIKLNSYASGTLRSAGGLSLVGEKGPELRVIGKDDGVIPSDITKNLWSWGMFTPASMIGSLSRILSNESRSMMVNISNLNLPQVKDGNDFVQYMKNNFWRQTVQFATT